MTEALPRSRIGRAVSDCSQTEECFLARRMCLFFDENSSHNANFPALCLYALLVANSYDEQLLSSEQRKMSVHHCCVEFTKGIGSQVEVIFFGGKSS